MSRLRVEQHESYARNKDFNLKSKIKWDINNNFLLDQQEYVLNFMKKNHLKTTSDDCETCANGFRRSKRPKIKKKIRLQRPLLAEVMPHLLNCQFGLKNLH